MAIKICVYKFTDFLCTLPKSPKNVLSSHFKCLPTTLSRDNKIDNVLCLVRSYIQKNYHTDKPKPRVHCELGIISFIKYYIILVQILKSDKNLLCVIVLFCLVQLGSVVQFLKNVCISSFLMFNNHAPTSREVFVAKKSILIGVGL